MLCCFRDGKRLLMGNNIYSQNPPNAPASSGTERGSVTRSNVYLHLPFGWFWTAAPGPVLSSSHEHPQGITSRWHYFKKSRQIRLNQTKSNQFGAHPSPGAAATKLASRSTESKRGNRFSLFPGEWAGVRASVGQYYSRFPNSPANPAKSNQIKPNRSAPVPGRSHVQTSHQFDFTKLRRLLAQNPNGIPSPSPGLRGHELPRRTAPQFPSTATRLRPARWLYFKEPRSIGLNQTKSNLFGAHPSPGAAITKSASRSTWSKRGNRFSLFPGEWAGVRASVGQYCRRFHISLADHAKSNQIKPVYRSAPVPGRSRVHIFPPPDLSNPFPPAIRGCRSFANPQISANHGFRALSIPFPGSAWPEIHVNHTKSNHFKLGLMTFGNGEAPDPTLRCLTE